MSDTMSFYLNDRSTGSLGPKIKVSITINDDGSATFNLSQEGPIIGDWRGLFFDLGNNERALGHLSVSSMVLNPETSGAISVANPVYAQGNDNLYKVGSSDNTMDGLVKKGGDAFDFGMEFGTAGMGKDDVRTVSFNLSADNGPLTLADFSNVDFGARLTSIGTEGGNRDGSSKIGEKTFTTVSPHAFDLSCVDENTSSTHDILDGINAVGYNFSIAIAGQDAAGNAITLSAGETKNYIIAPDDGHGAIAVNLSLDGSGHLTIDATDTPNIDRLSLGEHINQTLTYVLTQTSATEAGDFVNYDAQTINFQICGENDAPDAKDDEYCENPAYIIKVGTSLTFSVADSVLKNDSDIDRLDILKVLSVHDVNGQDVVAVNGTIDADVQGGHVTMNAADGSFVFTANSDNSLLLGEHKEVSFQYTIQDSNALSGVHDTLDTANVCLMVEGTYVAPPPPPPPPPPSDVVDLPTLKQGLSNVVFYVDMDGSSSTLNDIAKIKFQVTAGSITGDLDDFKVDGTNLDLDQWVLSQHADATILGFTVHAGQEYPQNWDTFVLTNLITGYSSTNPLEFQNGEGVFFYAADDVSNFYANPVYPDKVGPTLFFENSELGDGGLIKDLYDNGSSSTLGQVGITASLLGSNTWAEEHTITLSPTNSFIVT